MRPFIYVAGPYTRPDPITNTRTAIHAGQKIYDAGGFPFVPHLTLLWHMVIPHDDVTYWYEFDINALDHVDAVYRIPGDSTGADKEVARAGELGLRVWTDLDDLCAALRIGRGALG